MANKNLPIIFMVLGVVFCASLQSATASALLDRDNKIQAISEFLQVPIEMINIECPQNTIDIIGNGENKNLNVCLHYKDKQKRCELSISGLDTFPAKYQISVDIRNRTASPSDRWHTVMQLHSFPDAGEKWRCPPLSVEVEKKYFRVYNRWDNNLISKTLGYNCNEVGSSIQSRKLIDKVSVKYDLWQNFQINMFASPKADGEIVFDINQTSSKPIKGANLYNDKKAPYLKLGVYKPAGWSKSEIISGQPVCVSYKNFKMSSSKAVFKVNSDR